MLPIKNKAEDGGLRKGKARQEVIEMARDRDEESLINETEILIEDPTEGTTGDVKVISNALLSIDPDKHSAQVAELLWLLSDSHNEDKSKLVKELSAEGFLPVIDIKVSGKDVLKQKKEWSKESAEFWITRPDRLSRISNYLKQQVIQIIKKELEANDRE